MSIAFVVWLGLKLSVTYTTYATMRITYGIPNGKIVSQPLPSTFEVKITGRGFDLIRQSFRRKRQQIHIDIQNQPQQVIDYQYVLNKTSSIFEPYHIKVAAHDLNRSTLLLEDEVRKKVPLAFGGNLRLPPHRKIAGEVSFLPDSVEIKGPASIVVPIQQWRVWWGNRKTADGLFYDKLPLMTHPNSQVTFSPTTVACAFTIEPVTEKVLYLPIRVTNAPPNIVFAPNNVTARCTVTMSAYHNLDTSTLKAVANWQAALPTGELMVKIESLVPQVYLFDYSPKQLGYLLVEE